MIMRLDKSRSTNSFERPSVSVRDFPSGLGATAVSIECYALSIECYALDGGARMQIMDAASAY